MKFAALKSQNCLPGVIVRTDPDRGAVRVRLGKDTLSPGVAD
jgi:hypothetical protein